MNGGRIPPATLMFQIVSISNGSRPIMSRPRPSNIPLPSPGASMTALSTWGWVSISAQPSIFASVETRRSDRNRGPAASPPWTP